LHGGAGYRVLATAQSLEELNPTLVELACETLACILRSVSEVTRILDSIAQGDSRAAEGLFPLVYEDLRKLAAHKMASQPPGQTLQPTALVHEAWLRLPACGPPTRNSGPASAPKDSTASTSHHLAGGDKSIAIWHRFVVFFEQS
jgi:hypothetical protein